MVTLRFEIKYLVLDDADEKKGVSKKYKEVWEGVKKEIRTINGGKKMNEPIKLRLLRLIIRSVFSENGKLYPQLLLDEALYE